MLWLVTTGPASAVMPVLLYYALLFSITVDGQCSYGDIRLVSGYIEQEGRVEICVDDVWGVICDDGWDKTDAHIACQQLGYAEQGIIIV